MSSASCASSSSSSTPSISAELRALVLKLHDIEAFKLGSFKLKSGLMSPIYIDLRIIVSYPQVLRSVSKLMLDLVNDKKYDVICGVPYTALPIATVMSVEKSIPMVMRRKEVKDYGTGKIIEGAFQQGQICLVIEDLVTSGMSVFETIKPLNDVGLNVTDVVVLVDRQQGGKQNIERNGVNLHAVITISLLLQILSEEKRITPETVKEVTDFIAKNQVSQAAATASTTENKEMTVVQKLSYGDRVSFCSNPSGKKLLSLMEKKKTNLCVSLDVHEIESFMKIADQVGPYICLLKTHVDIIEQFDFRFVADLLALAKKHEFLIFEDRKYADIGNTVAMQYSKGIYRVSEWADIVNAHTVPGPGIIAGLKQEGLKNGRGLLLLAEMSSAGNLLSEGAYTKKTVAMAEECKDFVFGFISQSKLSKDPGMLYLTPGVDLAKGGDNLGQQYNTPELVIKDRECDVIIVGRGVYAAADPIAAAKKFREAGWQAYEDRMKQ